MTGLTEGLTVPQLRATMESAGALGRALFVVAFCVGYAVTVPGMLFVAVAMFHISEMNPDYPEDGPFSGITAKGKSALEADADETADDSGDSSSRSADAGDGESSVSAVAQEGAEGVASDGGEDAVSDGSEGAVSEGAEDAIARNEDEDDSSAKEGGSVSRET